jgi:hypothetical protein
MPPAFDARHPGLAALCRRFHVRRLELFGSATPWPAGRCDATFCARENIAWTA